MKILEKLLPAILYYSEKMVKQDSQIHVKLQTDCASILESEALARQCFRENHHDSDRNCQPCERSNCNIVILSTI